MYGITNYPVLLVEDNPDDVLITRRAWKKGGLRNQLYVVNNGEDALRFLNREDEYMDVPTPCLILLDLKMPRMDGFEVLKTIKGDEALRSIPVIVLTSSERHEDIQRAYQLGCNSYIVKPVSFTNFIETIVDLRRFWLTINKIPEK